jgi:hypothetical protein
MGAVRVTADCAVSYNYGLHRLAAGEVIPAGEFADHLTATGAPVEAETPPADPDQEPGDPDAVPDSTVADVLAWAGDDPDRVARALAVEQGRDQPRSTLVDALTKLTQ